MVNVSFSVIIPTCDRPEYLKQAVESVTSQSYQPLEIIVVDNGKDPASFDALPYKARIKLVRGLPKFGVSQARNLGAILSEGSYLAFLDDDDAWDVDYLFHASEVIKQTRPDVLLGRLRNMHDKKPIKGKQAEFHSNQDLFEKILVKNPGAVGSNSIFSSGAFNNSKGYDPYLTTGQDKALVLDLLLSGANAQQSFGSWVDFRDDGVGERQTDLKKRLKGKLRFLAKYSSVMRWKHRIYNALQVVRMLLWLVMGRKR